MDNKKVISPLEEFVLKGGNESEVWKDVVGYEGKYMVSSIGRVYSLTRRRFNTKEGKIYKGRLLKLKTDKAGYKTVALLNGYGKIKLTKVHRIVAMAFIPNPMNKETVDHIDGERQNNSVKNLRWATMKENINNPNTVCKKNGLAKGGKNAMAKKVYSKSLDTGEIKVYECMQDAADDLKIKYPKYIASCAMGKMKNYKGREWYFIK